MEGNALQIVLVPAVTDALVLPPPPPLLMQVRLPPVPLVAVTVRFQVRVIEPLPPDSKPVQPLLAVE